MCAFLFCLLLLCSLSIATLAEASKSVTSFTIDLIHSDSPLSPFYNPSLTPSQRTKNAILHSIARSKHIGVSKNEKGSFPKSITIPDPYGGYLMRYYIGTPPVERFAIADTGSDLIWVQCTPCMRCVPQNTPLFDPTKSYTFRKLRCDSQPCTLLPQNQRRCGKSGECVYRYLYGDHSFNKGIMSADKISFGSKGVVFPKFSFGCVYYNGENMDFNKMNTGLVGLGVGPLSLISQLGDQIGRKFSYCFAPLDSNSTSKMSFGDEATFKGKGVMSTPLILKSSLPSFYYLNLEGIGFGDKVMKITKGETDGNIIIDSGSTYTVLEQRVYNNFVSLVKEVLGVEEEKVASEPDTFCFRNKDNREEFPETVFHFTGGVKVQVDAIRMLYAPDKDNVICSRVSPADNVGSVFGNHAQVGYHVEYDLDGGKISFAPADCAI